jgi:hypothetical protein
MSRADAVMTMKGKVQIAFDSRDHGGLSRFYAEVMHHKIQDPPEEFKSWEEAMKA